MAKIQARSGEGASSSGSFATPDAPRLIVCGRYHNCISLARAADGERRRRHRIWSTKPKPVKQFSYIPIATDGVSVFHEGKLQPARDFLHGLTPLERKRLLSLTMREVDLLLPICLEFDAINTPFESAFPVFSGLKCADPLARRCRTLEAHLSLLRRMGVKGPTLTHQLVREASYRTERAIRSKNGLDEFFALASPAPYQEVFKLREERQGRWIVALDFNSMFGSCMRGEFPDPRSLTYRAHTGDTFDSDSLRVGMYRAVLSDPNSEFFCRYHPFKFTYLGRSFPFEIKAGQSVEVLLSDNELRYYSKFFDRVQMIESITSDSSISHPLAKKAEELYRERLRAGAVGEKVKERVLKMHLASLHSVTNKRRYQTSFFGRSDDLLQYVSDRFQIEFPYSMAAQEKLELLSRFRFLQLKFEEHGVRARIINHGAHDSLHALSSRVFANARLKMIDLLERVDAYPDAEVCYANADCVHVSVDGAKLDLFLETLSDLISDEMGALRVQCLAQKGYWFDPGRYWLYNNGQVVQFANKIFNHPGSAETFIRRRRVRAAYRGSMVSFAADKFLSIERAFSYSKHLRLQGVDDQDYDRYTYDEVSGLEVAGDSIEDEILASKRAKIELFERIATGTVSSDSALSRESRSEKSLLI